MTAREFLETLYESAEGWLVLWTMPDRASRWYKLPGERDAAAFEAVKLAKTHDVYFSVGLQAERAKTGRGTAENVAVLPAAWIDLDTGEQKGGATGKTYFATKEDALAFLRTLPKQPSLIIDTGHGLHAYWRFREPIIITSAEDRGYAMRVVKTWQTFIQQQANACGVSVDSVADLARVLRVVETLNHKGEPVTKAKPVVALVGDGLAVNPSELLEYAPAVEEKQTETAGDIVFNKEAGIEATKLEALLENDPKAKKVWNRKLGGRSAKWSASEWDMALADIVALAGWSNQDICDLLVSYRRKHNEGLKRPDYYRTTIATARKQAQTAVAVTAAAKEDATPEDKLAGLRRATKLPLARVIMTARPNEEAEFSFELVNRERIYIGSAEQLLSQKHVRALIASSTKVVMPMLKNADFEKLVQGMLDVCETTTLPDDMTEHGEIREAIAQYLLSVSVTPEGHDPDGEHPFVREGETFLVGSHFREWYKSKRLGDLTNRRFSRAMSLLGINPQTVMLTLATQGRTSRSCWRVTTILSAKEVLHDKRKH